MTEIASSVALVVKTCSTGLPRYPARVARNLEYSGYDAISSSLRFLKASRTFGLGPTVFSLKSSLSRPFLPLVGGLYSSISVTFFFGSIILILQTSRGLQALQLVQWHRLFSSVQPILP